jgi:hypothetical protein
MGTLLALIGGKLKLFALGAAGIALAVLVFIIRKSGADAVRLQQAKADIKAAQTIAKEKTKARGASDAQLDKDLDRWTRK